MESEEKMQEKAEEFKDSNYDEVEADGPGGTGARDASVEKKK